MARTANTDRPHLSPPAAKEPTVLWWSHSGRDYGRDRIVRNAFRKLGWRIEDFRPVFSRWGHIESWLRNIATPELVWVPCFRQRDVAAAQRWARRRGVPIVFDPLISAYDKQVFERSKYAPTSTAAKRLLHWESRLLTGNDIVIADTQCHADFFERTLQVDRDRLAVIPVSAEEEVFTPQPARAASQPVEVLFYGSFIGLQGPQTIAESARLASEVRWTFIGSGPLLEQCQQITAECNNVRYIPNVPYDTLPQRIGEAHVLLGIFGTSDKAARVIPNKVYQSLACARPVVTQRSDAYSAMLRDLPTLQSGIAWVPPGDPQALAQVVRQVANQPTDFAELSHAARHTFNHWFGNAAVEAALGLVLQRLHGTVKGAMAAAG